MSIFSPATITFLKGLGANNIKPWFEEHRADYDDHYIAPAKAFIDAVSAPLRSIAPDIRAEPRVNGSIFRINRDIRFSKDKTPYKDHLDLWFWEGDRKGAASGFFFRLTATTLILGAGNHGFDKTRLETFRQAIAQAGPRTELARIASDLDSGGHSVGGEHYARVPRGFSADDAAAERFLRFNGLWASLETAHPEELFSDGFADYCADRWRVMAPLHQWLTGTL